MRKRRRRVNGVVFGVMTHTHMVKDPLVEEPIILVATTSVLIASPTMPHVPSANILTL
jgi:hypothetical protein